MAHSFPVRLAFLAAALAMQGCAQLDTRPNAGPCPVSGTLYEASRLAEISGVEKHENVAFTASIEGVNGFCRYVESDPITVELDIDFALGRGPKADGSEKTYEYFVAVTRRDRSVLAKETYTFKAKFPKGKDVIRVREHVSGIVIPRAKPDTSGRNFEIIVGLVLTPEQLEFNQLGKRFRMDVKS